MKKDNLTRNFRYQFLYQLLILVIPLVVSPYLTRKLGATSLGIYTYTYSIAYYFIIFAKLGISKHGVRAISKASHDQTQLRTTFWSLFLNHVISSLLAICVYIVLVTIFAKENINEYYFQTINIFAILFDITWLFHGLENFRSVVIKNTFVNVAECIAIFTLVHSEKDIYIYTMIVGLGTLLGNAVMIPQALKIVKPIRVSLQDILKETKPLLLLFVAVVATTLYTVFDKTLLGLLMAKENVAYYEYANKIITVPNNLIVVIGGVIFPRACKLVREGDIKGQEKFLKISLKVIYFIGFAALFGLLSISEKFAVIYYGVDFATSGKVMMAMAAIPIITGLTDVVRTQYMIPNGMDKQYTLCVIIDAVVNLALSYILIPIIGIYGAVVGTVIAEMTGAILQIIICRKVIKCGFILSEMVPFLLPGILMAILVRFMASVTSYNFIGLLIDVLVGAISYCGSLLLIMVIFKKNELMEMVKLIKKKH